MKKFILSINTENDAFAGWGDRNGHDEGRAEVLEVARILMETANKLIRREDDFSMFRTLHDINGNDVGRAKFTD